MKSSTLQNNLNWQLLRIAITAKHGLIHIADKYGLTAMQLYTLCLLEADTSIPMNSLSDMIKCDASNITGIVDRLFSQNYIKREENPKDRREKMITLTSAGVKLCTKISQELSHYEAVNTQSLSEEEKAVLQTLLAKIITTTKTSIT